MTILWCGGEEIDFPNGIEPSTGTSSAYFDADMSRCSLSTGLTTSSIPLISSTFTPITSWWLHSVMYNSGYTSYFVIGLIDLDTGNGIYISNHTHYSEISLRKNNGSIVTLATETEGSLIGDGLSTVDLYVSGTGVSSNAQVYVNGVLKLDFTGDLSIDGATMNTIQASGVNTTFGQPSKFSQVIVADEDTRNMSLKTHVPDAAGDASDWTGDYTSIDETTLDDADTIKASAVDQEFQCNLTGMPAGDFICKAVKVAARNLSGTGIGVQIGVKTNATVDLDTVVDSGGSWENSEVLYQVNPITGLAFTPAELEALQTALKATTI